MSGVKEAYDQLAIDSLQLRFQQEYEHLCEQHGTLLVLDEVQTGFCRKAL